MRSRDKPQWLKQGMVFSDCQEALSFMIRRGGDNVAVDLEEQWERRRSEEALMRLRDDGIVLFIVNAHKCFGFEAEKADIESSIRCAERCHRLGLKVGTYIGETLGYETLFAEEPDAQNWLARRYDGNKIYWLDQTFRLSPCKFNQGWIDFQKKVIELAINKIGADFLHFDNIYVWPEPDSCHCDNCRDKFREFLGRKYTSAQRKRRLGFALVHGVLPPAFASRGGECGAKSASRLTDPLKQEWVDFRCEQLAQMYAQLCDHARKLKPDIVLECNPVITCINSAFLMGVDIPRLVGHGHFFWVEDPNGARIEPDGRMLSNIRTYKMARTLDNGAFAYKHNEDPRLVCLRVAEAMAFNLDCIGPMPIMKGQAANAYVQFFRKHRGLYAGTETVADVAVLRSFKSLAWESLETHIQVLLAEQMLIQKRIPFHIIFDEQMDGVDQYPVLVLANTQFISDGEVDRVVDYVKQGGSLVVIDKTARYDEMGRERNDSALLPLIGVTDRAAAKRATCGKGRLVYLPTLVLKRPWPERRDDGMADNRYWNLPENATELMAALSWCLGRRFTLEMTGRDYLAVELTVASNAGQLLVHAVNFDVAHPEGEVQVSVRIPAGKQVSHITVFDPATDASSDVPFTEENGRAGFTLPRVDIYTLARLNLA